YLPRGSDDSDVAKFYAADPKALERNRRLVQRLKELYRRSQVPGDLLPSSLPWDAIQRVLEVHHIQPLSEQGADDWSNMIVLSSNLHALVHADPDCRINLKNAEIVLFGVALKIDVRPEHLGGLRWC